MKLECLFCKLGKTIFAKIAKVYARLKSYERKSGDYKLTQIKRTYFYFVKVYRKFLFTKFLIFFYYQFTTNILKFFSQIFANIFFFAKFPKFNHQFTNNILKL